MTPLRLLSGASIAVRNALKSEARDSVSRNIQSVAASSRWNEVASRYTRSWWRLLGANEYRECRIKYRAFTLVISCEFMCVKSERMESRAEGRSLWERPVDDERWVNWFIIFAWQPALIRFAIPRFSDLWSDKSASRSDTTRRIQVKSVM